MLPQQQGSGAVSKDSACQVAGGTQRAHVGMLYNAGCTVNAGGLLLEQCMLPQQQGSGAVSKDSACQVAGGTQRAHVGILCWLHPGHWWLEQCMLSTGNALHKFLNSV
jgi:hypothetical protein